MIQLDILRAFAVLMIMGAHIPQCLFERPSIFTRGLNLWMQCGWTGVDLFFVISGFLVSGLLFREYKECGNINLWRFFIRRGLKIYPAFYAFLFLTTLYLILYNYPVPSLSKYMGELLYIQSYWPHIWEHSWSLAVEEHFYLFIGLFVLYRVKCSGSDPFRIFIPLTILISVECLFFRVLNAYFFPYTHQSHLFPTHLRIDSLLFGVMLSYLHHFRQDKLKCWVKERASIIGILSTVLIMTSWRWSLFDPFMHSFGFTFLYIGFGGFLLLFLYHFNMEKTNENWILKGTAFIGVYSYSIYLWHILFSRWFPYHVFSRVPNYLLFSFVSLFIYVFGSVSVGILMSKLIEIPVLNFRNKFFVSRSGILEVKS
ncbi:MAG: acyltransferase [Candidatus Omnitrophica bacterium]|nr:acyltransferase [Candidatus Omnitrophota bacterium]